MGGISVCQGGCVGNRWERLQGLTLAVAAPVTVLKASETVKPNEALGPILVPLGAVP